MIINNYSSVMSAAICNEVEHSGIDMSYIAICLITSLLHRCVAPFIALGKTLVYIADRNVALVVGSRNLKHSRLSLALI